jgi:hypothetical protein
LLSSKEIEGGTFYINQYLFGCEEKTFWIFFFLISNHTHSWHASSGLFASLVVNLPAKDLIRAALHRTKSGTLVLDHDLVAWMKLKIVFFKCQLWFYCKNFQM